MDRRNFFKASLLGSAAIGASLMGCKGNTQTQSTSETPLGEMEYRQFPGLGDDKISLLGYGCMRWPLLETPAADGNVCDQEAVNRLIDKAIEGGVNYFDTSPVYMQGWSEETTGIALSRHPREKYFIATKASNFSNSDYDFGVKMYHESLRKLRTDYIDFYLLHSIGSEGARGLQARYIDNGLLDFFLKEREAGRIRHLGFSFHGIQKCFDEALALHDQVHWDFVMIQMNYSDWGHADNSGRNVDAKYLYKELADRQIPVAIMEPLLGGRLVNLPVHIVERLKERRPQNSVASWAFRFVGSYPQIMTVLSGMTYMENLQDNLKTYSPLEQVSDEERQFLFETADLIHQYPIIPCNDCKYCMPCPYGIDIPANLLYYNKCINEGTVPRSMMDENYARNRRAYLVGFNRSIEANRQAEHCVGCGVCNPHCPQSIDIPTELQKIDKLVDQLKQNKLS